jgi:hypothetical protein
MNREDLTWMETASCAAPEHRRKPWTLETDTLPVTVVHELRKVCGACPVKDACLAFADTSGVSGGVWAGYDYDPEAWAWGGVEWVPVTRRKKVIDHQAALPLDGLGAA